MDVQREAGAGSTRRIAMKRSGRARRPGQARGAATAGAGAAAAALLAAALFAGGGAARGGTPATAAPGVAAAPSTGVGHLDGATLTPEEKTAALEHFDIIAMVKPTVGSGLHRARADALCNAPVELVKAALLDVRGYEKFMPKVTRSRVLKSEGSKMRVLIETRLPWPIENSWNILDVNVAAVKLGYSITWERITGSMKENRGFWLLSPYGPGGIYTRLAYEIEVYVPPVLPEFAVGKGFRKVAADYMNALRVEVGRRKDAAAAGASAAPAGG
jgi:ribosome-associated toxin RatA of RatAB toxin-antitoxin module